MVLVNDRERYLSCIAAWIESMLSSFTFSYQFDIILFADEDENYAYFKVSNNLAPKVVLDLKLGDLVTRGSLKN